MVEKSEQFTKHQSSQSKIDWKLEREVIPSRIGTSIERFSGVQDVVPAESLEQQVKNEQDFANEQLIKNNPDNAAEIKQFGQKSQGGSDRLGLNIEQQSNSPKMRTTKNVFGNPFQEEIFSPEHAKPSFISDKIQPEALKQDVQQGLSKDFDTTYATTSRKDNSAALSNVQVELSNIPAPPSPAKFLSDSSSNNSFVPPPPPPMPVKENKTLKVKNIFRPYADYPNVPHTIPGEQIPDAPPLPKPVSRPVSGKGLKVRNVFRPYQQFAPPPPIPETFSSSAEVSIPDAPPLPKLSSLNQQLPKDKFAGFAPPPPIPEASNFQAPLDIPDAPPLPPKSVSNTLKVTGSKFADFAPPPPIPADVPEAPPAPPVLLKPTESKKQRFADFAPPPPIPEAPKPIEQNRFSDMDVANLDLSKNYISSSDVVQIPEAPKPMPLNWSKKIEVTNNSSMGSAMLSPPAAVHSIKDLKRLERSGLTPLTPTKRVSDEFNVVPIASATETQWKPKLNSGLEQHLKQAFDSSSDIKEPMTAPSVFMQPDRMNSPSSLVPGVDFDEISRRKSVPDNLVLKGESTSANLRINEEQPLSPSNTPAEFLDASKLKQELSVPTEQKPAMSAFLDSNVLSHTEHDNLRGTKVHVEEYIPSSIGTTTVGGALSPLPTASKNMDDIFGEQIPSLSLEKDQIPTLTTSHVEESKPLLNLEGNEQLESLKQPLLEKKEETLFEKPVQEQTVHTQQPISQPIISAPIAPATTTSFDYSSYSLGPQPVVQGMETILPSKLESTSPLSATVQPVSPGATEQTLNAYTSTPSTISNISQPPIQQPSQYKTTVTQVTTQIPVPPQTLAQQPLPAGYVQQIPEQQVFAQQFSPETQKKKKSVLSKVKKLFK